MREGGGRVKRHVISTRISRDEWDLLHDAMKCLQFRRVSDLMREAFKLVLDSAPASEAAAAGGRGEKRRSRPAVPR